MNFCKSCEKSLWGHNTQDFFLTGSKVFFVEATTICQWLKFQAYLRIKKKFIDVFSSLTSTRLKWFFGLKLVKAATTFCMLSHFTFKSSPAPLKLKRRLHELQRWQFWESLLSPEEHLLLDRPYFFNMPRFFLSGPISIFKHFSIRTLQHPILYFINLDTLYLFSFIWAFLCIFTQSTLLVLDSFASTTYKLNTFFLDTLQ